MMNFEKALELYKNEPTREKLYEVADLLLKEMTLKEKIRTLQGHALGVTAKLSKKRSLL